MTFSSCKRTEIDFIHKNVACPRYFAPYIKVEKATVGPLGNLIFIIVGVVRLMVASIFMYGKDPK